MAQPIRVARVSQTGRIRKTTAWKQSTDSRIKELLSALGIDAEAYRLQALYRQYNRAQSLGLSL